MGDSPAWTIEELLRQECAEGASDLILTAGACPQLRINGALQPVGASPLTASDTERLAASILDEQQLSRLRQRRSLDLSVGLIDRGRFRVNVFHQRGSISMALRRIPSEIPSFETLGLPEVVRSLASRPHGLVLLTGPAGSGKSTTMAWMVDFINRQRNVHIVCIEDPIEYIHRHRRGVVEQREVRQDARSFNEALRSVFRQSPDIIMVGEMRDLETIRLALLLAETGHLILGTLHSQDTSNAIGRCASVFPTDEQQQVYMQLSLVLVGVMTQRLLPSLDGKRLVLACEVLVTTPAVRNLIRERKMSQIYSVLQTGRDDGMITMNESLRVLCQKGKVLPEVALEHSPDPKELRRMLGVQG